MASKLNTHSCSKPITTVKVTVGPAAAVWASSAELVAAATSCGCLLLTCGPPDDLTRSFTTTAGTNYHRLTSDMTIIRPSRGLPLLFFLRAACCAGVRSSACKQWQHVRERVSAVTLVHKQAQFRHLRLICCQRCLPSNPTLLHMARKSHGHPAPSFLFAAAHLLSYPAESSQWYYVPNGMHEVHECRKCCIP